MTKYLNILKIVLIFALTSTAIAQEEKSIELSQEDQAEKLVGETIAAHGGVLYDTASYSFVFRGNTYSFTNTTNGYQYTMSSTKKGKKIIDSLENGSLQRFINQKEVVLSQKEQDKYSQGLNSVIYFATLPHKLQDKAVIKKYTETTMIKSKKYHVIDITFQKEGGGKDYDDAFLYWINDETKKVDYLAYMYHVNGGGVRFRSAYNTRVVDGVTFQDYINYKAAIGTPLIELPALYENGKLKELSRIETENIINLKTKK